MANIKQKKIVDLPASLRRSIKHGILRHGKVKVVGLGIFEVRRIPARTGRNPKTGKLVKIRAYKKIKFRPTSSLKTALI